MIATLTGQISEKLLDTVVVDVGGVGYGLLVPQETYSSISVGDKIKLYVHEYIRESFYDLYGFSDLQAKELFMKLLDVSGVGPKVALSILNVGSLTQVRQAIAGGDVGLIQTAPGVGRRVAERVLVELKDKIGLVSSDDGSLLIGDEAAQRDEAVQALVALGYPVSEAVKALKNVDSELPTKERVTLALKQG